MRKTGIKSKWMHVADIKTMCVHEHADIPTHTHKHRGSFLTEQMQNKKTKTHSQGRNTTEMWFLNCGKEKYLYTQPVQKNPLMLRSQDGRDESRIKGKINPSTKERSSFYLSDCTVLKEQSTDQKLPTTESNSTIPQSH